MGQELSKIELTAEEFIREKIRSKNDLKGQMYALWKHEVNGEDCLRWTKEYADQQTQHLNDRLKEKDAEITELKSSLEYAENGHLAIFIQNQKLQSTISYQQERIGELEKSNENYNKLLNMSLYMAKLFNRTGDFSEFMRSNNLPTNPESLTKKQ